jgi:hypothetical protein
VLADGFRIFAVIDDFTREWLRQLSATPPARHKFLTPFFGEAARKAEDRLVQHGLDTGGNIQRAAVL